MIHFINAMGVENDRFVKVIRCANDNGLRLCRDNRVRRKLSVDGHHFTRDSVGRRSDVNDLPVDDKNLLRIQELVIVVIMVKGSNCYGTIVTAIWNLNLTKMHTFLNTPTCSFVNK